MKNPFESSSSENSQSEIQFNPKDTGEIPDLPPFNINSGGATTNFEDSSIPQMMMPENNLYSQPSSPFPPTQPIITTGIPQPQQSEKRKFIINDLYWLKNLKPMYNSQLNQGEANLLIISYNADFENLRLSFANCTEMNSKSVAIPMGARQNAVNIFSETCRELLSFFENMNNTTQFPFKLMNCERMMSLNANWTPNETIIQISSPQMIEIFTKQPNGNQHSFTMVLWQVKAFLECCKFMTNGNSWMMKLQAMINKD